MHFQRVVGHLRSRQGRHDFGCHKRDAARLEVNVEAAERNNTNMLSSTDNTSARYVSSQGESRDRLETSRAKGRRLLGLRAADGRQTSVESTTRTPAHTRYYLYSAPLYSIVNLPSYEHVYIRIL
jgi:hypothetical protein